MHTNAIAQIKITRFNAFEYEETNDGLAVEEPLEIRLAWHDGRAPVQKNISVTMRTPGNDEELAVGFLFTEGIIQHKRQITGIIPMPDGGNKITVTLEESVQPVLRNIERNFYATSSCGVCGKAGIDAIMVSSPYHDFRDDLLLDAGVFYTLQQLLSEHQAVFQHTGGLHAAALFTAKGQFIMSREDVGRHNALDKVIGAGLLNNDLPLNNTILLLSGRAGFELIQKAAMAGIRVVAAVGAPSSLAVEMAQTGDITLIGFLRHERFNIYTGSRRIKKC